MGPALIRESDGPGRPAIDLQRIIDTIPSLAWCTLPDGSHEFHNRRWEEFTGLSAEQSIGSGWTAAIHPEDAVRFLQSRQSIIDARTAGEVEARLRRFDGVYRWFLFRADPLRDENQQVLKWCGIATDIDDRKRSESLLDAEKQTLESLANGASLSDVLNNLCSAIEACAPPVTSMICLMDPGETQLIPGAGPRVPGALRQAITPWPIGPNRGSCGTAAFLKQRVTIRDISSDPRWPAESRQLALNHGLRAAWSEPIVSQDGRVLGTFCLYYDQPLAPTARDIELIEAAGRIALIAIEREHSRSALAEALGEIKKSEARLRAIIDTMPVVVWSARPDGSVDFLNKRWFEHYDLPPGDGSAWNWTSLLHPADLERVVDRWRTALATGEPCEHEFRVLTAGGRYRWVLTRAVPLRDERGHVIRWYGTDTDIDDLKRAEERLKREEEELRRMTDAIPQHIIVLAPDGTAVHANRSLLEYTGLTFEEMLAGDLRAQVFHPEDVERLRGERATALARGLPFETEQRVRGKDGLFRWILIRYNPFRDDEGRVLRWYATGTDIHDRKVTEERTRNENLALREEIDRSSMSDEIVGSSEPLRTVLAQVAKVAPTDSTVLISGETGTGKELIARAIHRQSNRAHRAFICVNCAAIPPALIASELFGYEKGAFTGAQQRRLGRFESANGGTLFLDEIGELPSETQVALLRVLQERQFERLGSNRPVSIDVRLLTATNRDLKAAVADGTFRQDLYYRLNVFPVAVPSLRERVDDIPLLVDYLVTRAAARSGRKIRQVSNTTMEHFQAYGWPGNIRELQNVIERAVILCEGETLTVEESWFKHEASLTEPAESPAVNLAERERARIEAALRDSRGRIAGKSGAAAKLGMPRQTLDSKIAALGIDKYRFKG